MTNKRFRGLLFCALALQIAACAPSQPDVPYPAYIRVDEIPDVFIAGLPGVRAKGLVGANSDSAGGGYRIDLPSSWQGTSGASPDKTLEIFVIDGEPRGIPRGRQLHAQRMCRLRDCDRCLFLRRLRLSPGTLDQWRTGFVRGDNVHLVLPRADERRGSHARTLRGGCDRLLSGARVPDRL